MFEGLYELVSKNENEAVVKLSDKRHPIFKAHFPRYPVLPGITHFEIVADIFDIEIVTIKKAKFMALVVPKQILTYKRDGNKFRVICEEKEVANFTL